MENALGPGDTGGDFDLESAAADINKLGNLPGQGKSQEGNTSKNIIRIGRAKWADHAAAIIFSGASGIVSVLPISVIGESLIFSIALPQ